MPDKMKTVWARLDKKGNLQDIRLEIFTGFKKLKVHYHAPNKRGMGRAKGNTHERETAKAFSLWLYGKPHYLKRTPLSGGWASGKAGDVILDHEIERMRGIENPPLYIECRSYKDVLQHDLLKWSLNGVPRVYTKWIHEVEAKCDGRLPILVLKGKRTKAWVMVRRNWFSPDFPPLLAMAQKSRLIIKTAFMGHIYLLPLDQLHRWHEDGEVFLSEWREYGGSAYIRRFGGNTKSGKGRKPVKE